jgi:hypothetical protein
MASKPKPCEWTTQDQAFKSFAGFTEKTQSAGHIKPLHWYVACRLVLEGGFHPDHIKPHPPFKIRPSRRFGLPFLEFDPDQATGSEAVVLGGLKTKNVDVVVARPGVGPVLAVSCKGTTGAFRNLTNRMEELIGDCTNLHISYPTLVMGYLHLLRANRKIGEEVELIEGDDSPKDTDGAEDDGDFNEEEISDPADAVEIDSGASDKKPKRKALTKNDMAFDDSHEVSAEIGRFALAISRLAGRAGIRDDLTRYESIGLALVEADQSNAGQVVRGFPSTDTGLDIDGFFERLYAQYDERFVYGAPSLVSVTKRLEWSPESTALSLVAPDYGVKLGTPKLPKPRKNR